MNDDGDDVDAVLLAGLLVPLLVLPLELLLFRVARFVARAEIRRFKSSRNNDFNGDTCVKKMNMKNNNNLLLCTRLENGSRERERERCDRGDGKINLL